MATIRALAFALIYGTTSLAASAGAVVVFETGGKTRIVVGEPVRVQSSLIQIKLGNSTVLSATRDAEFLLEQPDENFYRLHMGSGDVVVADLSGQKTWQLTTGLWLIPAAGNDASALLHHDDPALWNYPEGRYRQGFHFDDYVLLRQQSYLDSIPIPASVITSWVSSFLRGFSGSVH